MVELSGNIPFLWRLGAESSEGLCAVSMVVPYDSENNRKDLTIETSVLSLSSDNPRTQDEEVLEWNQDDINLFLKLVSQQQQEQKLSPSDSFRVDLTDPSIIEIIHVVAAAGFGMAFTSFGILKEVSGHFPVHSCDIGTFASLNTISGFKRCVVVDTDGDDVVCVLLDEVDVRTVGECEKLARHDLLLVKRTDILHPDFSLDPVRPQSAVVH